VRYIRLVGHRQSVFPLSQPAQETHRATRPRILRPSPGSGPLLGSGPL